MALEAPKLQTLFNKAIPVKTSKVPWLVINAPDCETSKRNLTNQNTVNRLAQTVLLQSFLNVCFFSGLSNTTGVLKCKSRPAICFGQHSGEHTPKFVGVDQTEQPRQMQLCFEIEERTPMDSFAPVSAIFSCFRTFRCSCENFPSTAASRRLLPCACAGRVCAATRSCSCTRCT